MKQEYKPGPGWKKLSQAVYQKGNFRILTSGCLVKSMILGRVVNVEEKDGMKERFHLFVKINGGNRKRGLMAYANHIRFCV